MGAKENFMYDEKGSNHLKLIDFGFSKAWDPEKNKKLKMNCALLAPQVTTLANDHDYCVLNRGNSNIPSCTSDKTVSIIL